MHKEHIYILGHGKMVAHLKLRFAIEGFEVQMFSGIADLLERVESRQPDLVLHTAYASDEKGMAFCVRLREKTAAFIVLAGEELSDIDIAGALGFGADLCYRCPFSPSVLIAQVHALFRRSRRLAQSGEASVPQGFLVDSPRLKIDVKSRTVIVDYKPIALTAREFDILALLASHPNQVFYTKQIFHSVWDADSILSGDDRPVYVHISNLRKKIEPDPLHACFIITVRGVGYKFQLTE